MGQSPEGVRIRGGSLRNIAYPRVTPGLPSELLAQRPDIREAEANLAAANANVVNARAQFLPSISLTGEGGYESAILKLLLRPKSVIYTAAASLTQPIFHGGQLLGNLDLQKGKQDELLQVYRKAVISGFADVENALDDIRKTAEREKLQRDVVTSSRRAFDISEQRLREGTVDLVTVLQTQQTLYAAQDALVQAQLAHVQAIVSLYQALGGGWLPKPMVLPMHGEFPQQLLAKARGSTRRTLGVAFILVAILAALYYVFGGPAAHQRRAGRFAAEGPVPVLATTVMRADVPVYLDAVGTIKALNTVTMRPQVDGRLLSVNFKEGDDVKKGDVLARIDPDHLSGATRPSDRQESAGRGAAGKFQDRSRTLREACRHRSHQQAAGRYAARVGGAKYRFGTG